MNEDYIDDLLNDVKIYTTYPKPRGLGGASNVNRMSKEISDSFKKLEKMRRLDVILRFMNTFADIKDVLKPVPFNTWTDEMINSLSPNSCLKLFQLDKLFFEKWIDKNANKYSIKKYANKIAKAGSQSDFLNFIEFVNAHFGKVSNILFTMEEINVNKIISVDKCGEIFLESIKKNDVFNVLELNIKIKPFCNECMNFLISKCSINGIEVPNEEYGFEFGVKTIFLLRPNKNQEFEDYKINYIELPNLLQPDGSLRNPKTDEFEVELLDFFGKNDGKEYAKVNLGLLNGEWIPISNSNDSVFNETINIEWSFIEDNEIERLSEFSFDFAYLDDNENVIKELNKICLKFCLETGEFELIND